MKNTIKLTASLAAFGLVQSAIAGEEMMAPAPAPAPASSPLSGDLSLGYSTEYGFRGFSDLARPAHEDTVIASVNLAYTLSDQWSLVAGYSHTSVTDRSVNNFDQNSYNAGVRYTTDTYSAEFGWQGHHGILGIPGNTGEIYLNLGTDCGYTGGNINLFIAHDVDELEGTYVDLSHSNSFDLMDRVGLDLTVGISYSFDYWDNLLGTGSDWNNVYVTIGLPLEVTSNLTVTPYMMYSTGFDALDPAGTPADEGDEVTWGLSASVNF